MVAAVVGTAPEALGPAVALLTSTVLLAPGAPLRGRVHHQPDDADRDDDAHHPQDEFPDVSLQHLALLSRAYLPSYILVLTLKRTDMPPTTRSSAWRCRRAAGVSGRPGTSSAGRRPAYRAARGRRAWCPTAHAGPP